jgi:predicted nucleic acid-binding protein
VIVLDTSILANVVADDQSSGRRARARLAEAGDAAIPDLADVETVAVLRRRWLAGDLTDGRFRSAIDDLLTLPLARFPIGPLMRRAFELRANVPAYAAAYIALAEGLACPLVTGDARLAGAPGVNCEIEILAT